MMTFNSVRFLEAILKVCLPQRLKDTGFDQLTLVISCHVTTRAHFGHRWGMLRAISPASCRSPRRWQPFVFNWARMPWTHDRLQISADFCTIRAPPNCTLLLHVLRAADPTTLSCTCSLAHAFLHAPEVAQKLPFLCLQERA